MHSSSQNQYLHEDKVLAPYALKSSQSRGRKYEEEEDPLRAPFQRDRDRIIHSKAFRRLSGKTQVFVASYGDHFRTRLTHSIEVAQVSRDIARALGLHEDLVEAIALAHDLGHTPFGHAGEEAMDEIMRRFQDRFEHNEQSLRVVEVLEKKSFDYPGLNLTFEVREGLMKHRSLHKDGKTPVIHSLEAQVVDIADAIAYHHHDLDDGLRAKILTPESLAAALPLWAKAMEDIPQGKGLEDLSQALVIRNMMKFLIADVFEETKRRIKAAALDQPLAKPLPQAMVSFSAALQAEVDQVAEFLGSRFYLHEKVSSLAHQGKKVIQELFHIFSQDETLLPLEVRSFLSDTPRHIVMKDYIAGMTDEYATRKYEEYKT